MFVLAKLNQKLASLKCQIRTDVINQLEWPLAYLQITCYILEIMYQELKSAIIKNEKWVFVGQLVFIEFTEMYLYKTDKI